MSLLRDLGINAIRLRVWVNPENDTEDVKGWCNKGDVLLKAWRAHNLGYRLMIDFHYSDRWADPVQQAKPKAWENYTVEELEQAIADHTKDVLGAIKEMGIDVEWVQVGNETHQGMLFPTGQTTSSDGIKNFAKFINSGYNAVKEIYPNAKVIVHLDQGNDANLYNRIFGYLHEIIGRSSQSIGKSNLQSISELINNQRKYQRRNNYHNFMVFCKAIYNGSPHQIEE